jgi:hypothetical protein
VWRERGRGVYIDGGWLGEGARVAGASVDRTAAVAHVSEADS